MTPEIAPEAPIMGIVDAGFNMTWAKTAAIPQSR